MTEDAQPQQPGQAPASSSVVTFPTDPVALVRTFWLPTLVGIAAILVFVDPTVAIAVQNSVQVVLLRRFEGLWPFDATFLKPLGAGVAAAGVMFLVRETLVGAGTGGLVVVAGAALGLVTYVGALVALGVNDRDRLGVTAVAARYRRAILVALGGRSGTFGDR